MRVTLILNKLNRSWIIEKFADRLAENLAQLGVEATITYEPSASSDINHWMSWAFVEAGKTTRSTMMITHIDDPYKVQHIKKILDSTVDVGVCMSYQMRQWLIDKGLQAQKLSYVLPAHDCLVKPKRTVIGLTTRLYSDGRKREELLVRLAKSISLELFHFEIIGDAWEKVIPVLEDAGATVSYYCITDDFQEDYRITLEKIPTFDYYLYLGLDEGSMGTLDALAAGVKTIVTPQGFHLDTACDITHPFWDFDDLKKVFQSIVLERELLMSSVREWTWLDYARDHVELWENLLDDKSYVEDSNRYLCTGGRYIQNRASLSLKNSSMQDEIKFYLKMTHPLRIRSAVSKLALLKPLRRMIQRQ